MYDLNLDPVSFLDKVRSDRGIEDLRDFFKQLTAKDLKGAKDFINDKDLQFPTLFVLRDEIQRNNLEDVLTKKNKIALLIVKEILTDKRDNLASEKLSFDYVQMIHNVLKWIIETGFKDDGMDDDYDRVLDISAILLTKMYKDKTILNILVDMIFDRYKKGALVHDLVWAFFQIEDPQSLILIGEKLLSSIPEDVKIAARLLNFIPEVDKSITKEKKYTTFLNWMKENGSFLEYTGESFQQKTNPSPYKVVLEGKYLCKNICCETGRTLGIPSREENQLLNGFKKLDYDTKILLSNFSIRIHQKNIYLWDVWLHYSLEDQIKIAKIGGVQ
ncbi:hypothetical protein CPAST_c13780 [Clostridium pasteurianum DSM 525 = ATCC 6013]|uniref:Uncharacterized protein n=1 Tax=Clostridium pasteurianum DSM 525 = ATCC 6013 TaxID=1262449 RepID=A0A0H3J3P4_CLOPA|nr:hypothetical protein [Clostridium pasteurianum]AJA47457.1 hypothetical protein CPAST_c13780 [Clostridium pasteurianum DSM 525 = ATCC 6013]AJA51445.1 hypothetical protein CLPA_c13780 [Clostridium pasteurianum DSM 525 = ATCC 6013]AOZ74782.1 hypothetical protein AQ983_06655 [Clostridium pasteurianum DSM 525 = ATCC 6013]AOZ78578.1 hypothetical protein AQ984_06645 [Clostridium pasteurianum]ELP58792.1 hypothetical protein F502_13463 [Clostridium pasteurianum DSM 525 = ATCC 6013]